MKLGIVSTLALGCWLLGTPALAGDRAPSTLPRSPVPPDAPRVFTATEDIAPPYEVTCEVKGDSIFAYINGVFVQKMVVAPHDRASIDSTAKRFRRFFESRIDPNSVVLITERTGVLRIPIINYAAFIRELERARQGKQYNFHFIPNDAVCFIRQENK